MSYESIEAAIEDYESQLCACEDRLSRLRAENKILRGICRCHAEMARLRLGRIKKLREETEELKKELSAVVWRLESRIAALKAQLCWIPVGERLPEEGKMVNFSLNSSLRTIYKGWWESGDNLKDGNDMWYGESNQQWFSMNEVALWCAIPPLPEEAQND